MRVLARLVVLGALVSSVACSPAPAPAPTEASAPASTPSEVAAEAAPAPVDLRRCKPAPGTSGSPRTIAEAVALANGLPFPVSAECFVEALDRPLRLEATWSRRSVQPAVGERSPRILIWGADSLVMTIVIDGPGRDLIEFGEFVTPRRTVKGEIAFPLAAPTSLAIALGRVRNPEHPEITSCFVCHDREEDEPRIPGGRSSLALRPRPATLVPVGSLVDERARCDPAEEPARCRWLEALVDHGPLERRAFDASLPLF